MADAAPQGNNKILTICRVRKKFEGISKKGICEAESMIDNFCDALFDGSNKECVLIELPQITLSMRV